MVAHGEPAARALVALLEGEWQQLKALRRRFAGGMPDRSILKRRSLATPLEGPVRPPAGCRC